jgi:homoserine acetyltransferase
MLTNNDARNRHETISSIEGHDGFLIEIVPVGHHIGRFLKDTE